MDECEYILNHLTGLQNQVELDLTLARGLNYYTGAIFEVKALDVQIGSITGGGRYDNLTGIFGMPGLSGVGISFGADRIFDVLNQLDLYPKEAVNGTRLLFVNFGEAEAEYCLPEDEEADELCQPEADSLRGHCGGDRDGRGKGDAEEYADGRTAAAHSRRTACRRRSLNFSRKDTYKPQLQEKPPVAGA